MDQRRGMQQVSSHLKTIIPLKVLPNRFMVRDHLRGGEGDQALPPQNDATRSFALHTKVGGGVWG